MLLTALALAGPALGQSKALRTNALALNEPRGSAGPAAPASAAPVAATKELTGRVETAHGALPGAVVRLASSGQSCVTDAQGNFHFAVPANAGPLGAVATYAGFADVSTTLAPGGAPAVVQLLTPIAIKMGRKQQLKTYLKTARREVRHDLRQIK
ncbi:hypothetical protein ACFQ48_15665 [Hymenobacter caeli]|uniref:Carboxypeptidase-like regulatory domain-containing protein n=1 Tax=Hymenobacter caeli TaxID=2735894 RepID=A0ABX2FVV8_9BACT|nr:hypothetical protein [Hymenobacter caeli]NRT20525.1 hypothetical protein [Hymenobacter caeli]